MTAMTSKIYCLQILPLKVSTFISRDDKGVPAAQRLKLFQSIQQVFWKTWSRDYLVEFNIRMNGFALEHV